MNRFIGMSNFEINCEVALSLGIDTEVAGSYEKEIIGDSLSYYDDQRVIHTIFEDYCGRPELAYPIILDNKISLYWKGGVDNMWFARTVHTARVEDIDPLRAAMIAYLMQHELETKYI